MDQFKEMTCTEVMTTVTGNPFSALYPQFCKLACIVLTLPISTDDVETNKLTMDNLD